MQQDVAMKHLTMRIADASVTRQPPLVARLHSAIRMALDDPISISLR
jgi:hypothetical protein